MMGVGNMKEFFKKNEILHQKIPKPTIFKILPIANDFWVILQYIS